MTHTAQLWFFDPINWVMASFWVLHDHIMLLLVVILSVVGGVICLIIVANYSQLYLLERHKLEIVWTILPAFSLLLVAGPSLSLLYLIEESYNPSLVCHVIGHQWYWEYCIETASNQSYCSDMYLVPTTDITTGQLVNLETHLPLTLPASVPLLVLVTSGDVIHSWSLPSLAVKIDAIPGRLNSIVLQSQMVGTLYGQCSEICGANHSFIPIKVELVLYPSTLNFYANS